MAAVLASWNSTKAYPLLAPVFLLRERRRLVIVPNWERYYFLGGKVSVYVSFDMNEKQKKKAQHVRRLAYTYLSYLVLKETVGNVADVYNARAVAGSSLGALLDLGRHLGHLSDVGARGVVAAFLFIV